MADLYAVIGNPISHTKSPLIHGAFAAASDQDMMYEALLGEPGQFAATVDAFRRAGGCGMNVTAPFKLDAHAYATQRSEQARLAGAVKALKFEGDAVLAENFDGIGLVRDITVNLASPIAGRHVLVLGAGGAVRGMLLPFLQEKPGRLVVANRTVEKAQKLAETFSAYGPVEAVGYGDLAGQQFDIVINATSASLFGELPSVPAEVFIPGCLAYELVYGKGMTPFLTHAKASRAGFLADGVGMLVEQAAEAFHWWRGVRPDTKPMIAQLT